MEGLASLGISLPALIAQIISFVVLFGLLYLVAYKPIMRVLDERSRKIRESVKQTEYTKEQAAQAEQGATKHVAVARRKAQNMIDQAVQAGEEIRRRAQQKARQEAETLIARAHAEIQRERDEAIDELRKEFTNLTIQAAGKVIDRSLEKGTHRRTTDQVLKEGPGLRKD